LSQRRDTVARSRNRLAKAAFSAGADAAGLGVPAPIPAHSSPPLFGPDPAGSGMRPVKGANGIVPFSCPLCRAHTDARSGSPGFPSRSLSGHGPGIIASIMFELRLGLPNMRPRRETKPDADAELA